MSLLEKIKKDQLQARKDKNKEVASILTVLIGEITAIGKDEGNRDTTDDEALKLIIKSKKSVMEMSAMEIPEERKTSLLAESKVYDTYLPKHFTEEELRKIITTWHETNYPDSPNLGGCMQALKRCYEGQYDGKLASKIVKEIYG